MESVFKLFLVFVSLGMAYSLNMSTEVQAGHAVVALTAIERFLATEDAFCYSIGSAHHKLLNSVRGLLDINDRDITFVGKRRGSDIRGLILKFPIDAVKID